jgi:membrane fusion protein, heavy metal efflux system
MNTRTTDTGAKKGANGFLGLNPTGLLAFLLLLALSIGGCSGDAPETEAPATEAAAEEHAEDGDEIHLTSEQAAELGIEVAALESGSATAVLTRPATVTFDLDRVAKVGPRIPAKIVTVLKDLGDRVEAGGALAVMSSIELGKAKADYLIALAHLETAEATLAREQQLFEQNISSEAELISARSVYREEQAETQATREALRLYGLSLEDIDQIQAGGEDPLSIFHLKSPFAGVIQERDVSPGQTVDPQETPFHVADPSRLWLMMDAFEQDVPFLSVGQEVSFSVRSLPGRVFRGRTDWVSYALDEETRTVHVRASVANTDGALRAGMFGTAQIHTESAVYYAMIPVDAVQTIEGTQVVFVPGDEANSFVSTPVRLGGESEGFFEIVSGLEPGQPAVIAGAFGLKSAQTAGSISAEHGH